MAIELIKSKLAPRRPTPPTARRLGVQKTGKVMAIPCRHSADGVPFAIEDRLIDLDAVPEAATADFAIEPPGSWLLHHVPWTEAEHSISAIVADDRPRQRWTLRSARPAS